MDTLEFLRLVLPPSGTYFAAAKLPSGGYRHYSCESIEELAAKCLFLDTQSEQVFYALASFKEARVPNPKPESKSKWVYRTHENVKLVKAFWLDMDVGASEPGKPPKYPDQKSAVAALIKFCKGSGLPIPLVVSSGYGIHVYWLLTEAMMPGQWEDAAKDLKKLTVKSELLVDHTRTSDMSSVLRPIGTFNRKVKDGVAGAAPVAAINNCKAFDANEFITAVRVALGQRKDKAPSERAAFEKSMHDGLVNEREFKASSAHKVADKCNQIRLMRDTGGCVPEPVWYHAIQLLNHTIEGKQIIHQWSSGYAKYSHTETDQKISQVVGMGPTLCSTFEAKNPDGCKGCPFKGSISTPLELGVTIEAAPVAHVSVRNDTGTIEEIAIPAPAAGFTRGGEANPGLYMEHDGVPLRFYKYDLYPIALEVDEGEDAALVRIRHWLPKEGYQEFTIPFATLQSPQDFVKAVADHSVVCEPLGKFKDTLRIYVVTYIQKLQETIKQRVHYVSLGWKEDDKAFLVGDRLITQNGIHKAGMSSKVKQVLKGFDNRGSLEAWTKITAELDKPGREAYAFTVMLGFGAPLMKFSRHDGLLCNIVGETGRGKSSIGEFMSSIYNDYDQSKSSMNSTITARFAKLGVYGNLPLYIDEITLTDQKTLSELAYNIANGGAREKMTKESAFAEVQKWKTIVLASSNRSIYEVLAAAKLASSAEAARVFEYEFPDPTPEGKHLMTKIITPCIRKNYGVAGDAYLSWLVKQDKESLSVAIEKMADALELKSNSTGVERFWLEGAAASIVGSMGAYQQGVIAFNPARTIPWICKQVKANRGVSAEMSASAESLLARYLDETQGERLIVNLNEKINAIVVDKPISNNAMLTQRWEKHTGLLWVNAAAVRKWLTDHGANAKLVQETLIRSKTLDPNMEHQKRLGSGTPLQGKKVYCWKITMEAQDVDSGTEAAV